MQNWRMISFAASLTACFFGEGNLSLEDSSAGLAICLRIGVNE